MTTNLCRCKKCGTVLSWIYTDYAGDCIEDKNHDFEKFDDWLERVYRDYLVK